MFEDGHIKWEIQSVVDNSENSTIIRMPLSKMRPERILNWVTCAQGMTSCLGEGRSWYFSSFLHTCMQGLEENNHYFPFCKDWNYFTLPLKRNRKFFDRRRAKKKKPWHLTWARALMLGQESGGKIQEGGAQRRVLDYSTVVSSH